MEDSVLETFLSVLLAFFAHFFTSMALNPIVALPTNVFPASGGLFTYALAGGDLFLASYFIIDMGAIAIRAINFGACSQWKQSLQGFVYHKVPIGASVFVKGARFVASNFVVDGISYGLIGLLAFFLLLFYV